MTIHDLSTTQQVEMLRRGELSSLELVSHYLDRIERHSAALGAFTTVTAELALVEARHADSLLSRGEGGALTGIPLGVKDLHATSGVATSGGSAALADFIPKEDAWSVGLLRGSGAVLVGKTNAAEFGATCYTEAYTASAPAVTPYDATRYSSGSSGGAATAVAAGLLPFAHASDGAGSTRTPAATCNLIGVKPSRGLVSLAPAVHFMSTGSEGVVARNAADAALMLDVLAQPSPGDLYGWAPKSSFSSALSNRPHRPLRVAVWDESGIPGATPHPEVASAVLRTEARLVELGHDVRRVSIPALIEEPIARALRTWLTASVAAAAIAAVPQSRRTLLSDLTLHLIEQGASYTAFDLLNAQTMLARYASRFLAAFESFDVALTPTTASPPVPTGHFFSDGVPGILDRMLEWSAPTPWANLTGQPAIAVPAGFTAAGLPVGVQLVGRARTDAELLSLAQDLERLDAHTDAHPPVWYDSK